MFIEQEKNLNGSPVVIPKNIGELIQSSGDLDRVEMLLRALQNLTVSVTLNGETRQFPIQFGQSNAIIDIRLD